MKDRYRREINYLRISVTDRCNLRCRYCMPEHGIRPVDHKDILSFDEIGRVAAICAGLGIKNIKITGGEPLVRKDTAHLIRKLKEISGIRKVTMTTNGLLMEKYISELIEAGLDGVNISLDTLKEDRYMELTGSAGAEKVLKAIMLCTERGLATKVNMVPVAGFNDDEVGQLAALAKNLDVDVRFIEMMPVGQGRLFQGCNGSDVLKRLEAIFGQAHAEKSHENHRKDSGSGPAIYYRFDGFRGRIGFIDALSKPFCSQCTRVRLTSEGFLRPCLQFETGENLKELMRAGCSDKQLEKAVQKCVFGKPSGHCFNSFSKDAEKTGIMSKIGG